MSLRHNQLPGEEFSARQVRLIFTIRVTNFKIIPDRQDDTCPNSIDYDSSRDELMDDVSSMPANIRNTESRQAMIEEHKRRLAGDASAHKRASPPDAEQVS